MLRCNSSEQGRGVVECPIPPIGIAVHDRLFGRKKEKRNIRDELQNERVSSDHKGAGDDDVML